MSFTKKYKKLDKLVFETFIKWLNSQNAYQYFDVIFGGHKLPDIYMDFVGPEAKGRSGFDSALLKRVSDIRFVARETIIKEGKAKDWDDVTEEMLSKDSFVKSVLVDVVKACDRKLDTLFDTFLDSQLLKSKILTFIKENDVAKQVKLPTAAEKDLIPAVIAAKMYDNAGWEKALRKAEKKHKTTGVAKMARALQKKIDAQGKNYKVPMPLGRG